LDLERMMNTIDRSAASREGPGGRLPESPIFAGLSVLAGASAPALRAMIGRMHRSTPLR